jgi:hypothetical protein
MNPYELIALSVTFAFVTGCITILLDKWIVTEKVLAEIRNNQ